MKYPPPSSIRRRQQAINTAQYFPSPDDFSGAGAGAGENGRNDAGDSTGKPVAGGTGGDVISGKPDTEPMDGNVSIVGRPDTDIILLIKK
jgi:hypothetical protein